jgi:hypothetical protein
MGFILTFSYMYIRYSDHIYPLSSTLSYYLPPSGPFPPPQQSPVYFHLSFVFMWIPHMTGNIGLCPSESDLLCFHEDLQFHLFSCKQHDFLCVWKTLHCVCIAHFLNPFIGCWAPRRTWRTAWLLWTMLGRHRCAGASAACRFWFLQGCAQGW